MIEIVTCMTNEVGLLLDEADPDQECAKIAGISPVAQPLLSQEGGKLSS